MSFSSELGYELKVLLVDDESALLEQAELFLKKEISSINLRTVNSPRKALNLLEDNYFDCVVSDYQMPEMNGLELLKVIREDRGCDIPFIMFTGKGRKEVAIKALNLGADRYLQKGGDPNSQYSILAENIVQEAKRRRIEEELMKKDQRHQEIFNNAHDSLWVINVKDDEFIYEDVNPQFYEFTNFDVKNVIGRSLKDLFDSKTVNKIRKDYEKIVEEKEPIEKEQELKFSGEKRWHLTTLSPILENGEVDKIVGSGKDITKRKKMENELRENQERYKNIFHETPLGSFHFNKKGIITECNERLAKIMNTTKKELIGFNILNDLENKEVSKEVKESLKKGEGYYEGKFITPNQNKKIYIKVFLKGIKGEDNVIDSGVGLVEDYSDRREMEKEIRRKKKKFEKFFEDLNSITFISKLNGDIIETNKKAAEELGYSKEELENMNIIKDLSTLDTSNEEEKERNEKIKNGNSITFEDELKRNDGSTFRVKAEVNPLALEGKIRSASVNKKIEEKKRLKEKLNTILINSPNLVFEYDSKGNYKQIYAKNSDKLGGKKVEMIDKNVSKFLPKQAAKKIKEAIKKSLETQENKKITFKLNTEGESKWFSEHFTPLSTKEDGHVVSISRDITERIKAEKELEKSANKFKKIFNNSPEPMALIDYDNLVVDINSRFEEEFGYKLNEVQGKSINDIVVPERLLDEGHMLDNKSKNGYTNFETVRRGKEGEFHVSISATPITLNGEKHILATYKNIEKRKKAEKELKQSKEKYRSLIENLNEIIYNLNKKGEVKYISPNIEEISGYKPSEVIGKNFVEFVHPDDKEGRMQNFKKVLSGNSFPTEYRFITKNNEVKWVRTHGKPVKENGKTIGVQGVLSDITERKKTEERESLLHSLLRHDIRNKSQAIQGYLQLLQEQDLPNEAKQHIKKAEDGIKNELELIKKVNLIRKAEEEQTQKIDIKKYINKAIKQIKPQAQDKNIKIQKNYQKSLKATAGPLITDVLKNILENAIQHSNCQKIRISTKEKNQVIQINIEDDGEGIPDKQKQKICKKRYTTDKEKGTGLGMYLVKTIINKYSGSIEVKDSKLGGTSFNISLQKL